MSIKKTFSEDDVKHIATLAHIPVSAEETTKLAQEFTKTLEVINKLDELTTTDVELTHNVTGSWNVFREDVVDVSRMFSQQEALKNAKNQHNGYFVVDQILTE